LKAHSPIKPLPFYHKNTKSTKESLNHQIERYREDDVNPDEDQDVEEIFHAL